MLGGRERSEHRFDLKILLSLGNSVHCRGRIGEAIELQKTALCLPIGMRVLPVFKNVQDETPEMLRYLEYYRLHQAHL